MSTLKTKIDNEEVFDFLKKNFSADIPSLTPIKEGETSQAFSFSSKAGEFVIRVRSACAAQARKDGFEKDKYAYEHFDSENIPVPCMFQMGRLNDQLCYAITEKAKGKIIDYFTKDEVRTFMLAQIETLDAIHNFDVSNTSHFGDWDSQGHARKASWKEYLLQLVDDFSVFEDKESILKCDVIETVLARFTELIDYCPNIRHLVHGDFGFNNVLSDGKRITGVIDWELSKYGDFLYDAAWLSFWETEIDYAGIFLKHYKDLPFGQNLSVRYVRSEDTGVSVPNFHERILCYKLHFGLESLKFSSDSQQEATYRWTKERLLGLIG